MIENVNPGFHSNIHLSAFDNYNIVYYKTDNQQRNQNGDFTMTKKRVTTDAPEFNNHPIQTDKDKGLRCDKKILKKIDETDAHARTNDRVMFMRYDVGAPTGYDDPSNDAFRSGQANFIKTLKRSGLAPRYVAVREQSREKLQHYHVCLWLDGRKTQSIYDHIAQANDSFASAFGVPDNNGLVDDCTEDKNGKPQENGIMLRKDDPDYQNKVAQTLEWASYLAKVNQKNTPPGTRELFSSRLTKKKKNDKKST